jgi:hypothetical protein
MSFGFGNFRRCSVQEDCIRNAASNSTASEEDYELYEFALDVTLYDGVLYRWQVQDALTGRPLLECSTDVDDPIGNRDNCTEARGTPGYYCMCLPRRSSDGNGSDGDDRIGACRRVLFGLPARGKARVAVDGPMVADFEGPPFDPMLSEFRVAGFDSATVGGDSCPAARPCSSDDSADAQGESSLLEIYLFQHFFEGGVLPSLSIGLERVGANNTNASSSSSSSVVLVEAERDQPSLVYASRCVAASGCYNLTLQIPEASRNSSTDWGSAPLSVTLGGVYYAHQDVLLQGKGGEQLDPPILASYSTLIGRCTESACAPAASGDSLEYDGNGSGGEGPRPEILSVTVNARDNVPWAFSWFLFGSDGGGGVNSNAYEVTARDESQFRFGMGYPALSRYQTYVCLFPDVDDEGNTTSRLTTFAMERDVPDGVSVAVEKDGVPLPCREAVPAPLQGYSFTAEGMRSSFLLSAGSLVTAPLDGTCASNPLSAGAIAGIVIGALAGVALLVLAAARLRRRRRASKD